MKTFHEAVRLKNKLLVEPLQGRAVDMWRKSSDGGVVLMERIKPRAGDQMSKILNLRSSENTLLQVEGVEAAEVENTVEVKLMIL